MTKRAERIVVVDQSDPNRGRYDPARVGKPNPNDKEPYPEISEEDREATRAELAELPAAADAEERVAPVK